jgi:hypothetical protein
MLRWKEFEANRQFECSSDIAVEMEKGRESIGRRIGDNSDLFSRWANSFRLEASAELYAFQTIYFLLDMPSNVRLRDQTLAEDSCRPPPV